jgi:hypothetical protein
LIAVSVIFAACPAALSALLTSFSAPASVVSSVPPSVTAVTSLSSSASSSSSLTCSSSACASEARRLGPPSATASGHVVLGTAPLMDRMPAADTCTSGCALCSSSAASGTCMWCTYTWCSVMRCGCCAYGSVLLRRRPRKPIASGRPSVLSVSHTSTNCSSSKFAQSVYSQPWEGASWLVSGHLSMQLACAGAALRSVPCLVSCCEVSARTGSNLP